MISVTTKLSKDGFRAVQTSNFLKSEIIFGLFGDAFIITGIVRSLLNDKAIDTFFFLFFFVGVFILAIPVITLIKPLCFLFISLFKYRFLSIKSPSIENLVDNSTFFSCRITNLLLEINIY
ncbi:MAG: hypothetical protein HUJ61_05535 [Bacilli bacterium]|nr:hypothetical protein [Bacilli bacterium]